MGRTDPPEKKDKIITIMNLIMNCITVNVPQCSTQYRSQCSPVTKQECQTVYRDQCKTQYEQKCSTQYREEVEYYTETECNTDYKEDCEYQWEGTGNNKVWAPIPGSCRNNAYDKCGDVQKQKLRQVPYDDCQSVPKKVCDGAGGSGSGFGGNFNSGSGNIPRTRK